MYINLQRAPNFTRAPYVIADINSYACINKASARFVAYFLVIQFLEIVSCSFLQSLLTHFTEGI